MEPIPSLKKRYLIFNVLAIGLMTLVATFTILNNIPFSWHSWIDKKFGSLDEEITYLMLFLLTLPVDYLIAKLMQKISNHDKLKPFLITSLISAIVFYTIMPFLIIIFVLILYCGLNAFSSCSID